MTFQLPLPPYLKGKNISVQTIITQTSSGAGVLTAATTYDMKTLGIIDTWEFTGTAPGSDIHPTDGTIANYISTGVDDFEFKVGEIQRTNALSVLEQAWNTTSWYPFECDVADDAGGATWKFAIMATRFGGSITYGVVEDKNTVMLTLKPCGVLPYYGSGTPPF